MKLAIDDLTIDTPMSEFLGAMRRVLYRLSTAVEPERDRVCPDTCCDATPCPLCIAAGTAICADCEEESTDMVCGDCVARLTRERERVPGEVYKWTATAAHKLEYLLRDYPDDKETAKLIADWPSVVAHGTPTGDGETCILCGKTEGEMWTWCDDCYHRVSPEQFDFESCEMPEQWEALHARIEYWKGETRDMAGKLDAANKRTELYASQYTENQARMQRVSREFANACDERDSARAELELRRNTVSGVALDWIGRFIAAPLLGRLVMAALLSREPADHPFGAMWGEG